MSISYTDTTSVVAWLIWIFLVILPASVGLAFIPATIARHKGYSSGGFWVFGFFLFLPALIVALCLSNRTVNQNSQTYPNYNQNTNRPVQQNNRTYQGYNQNVNVPVLQNNQINTNYNRNTGVPAQQNNRTYQGYNQNVNAPVQQTNQTYPGYNQNTGAPVQQNNSGAIELDKYYQLLQKGAITQEEFDRIKDRIINGE